MQTQIDKLFSEGKLDDLVFIMDNDVDWMNRLDAAEALVKLQDPRGLEYLNKSLNSKNSDIREVAKEILSELNKESIGKDVGSKPTIEMETHNPRRIHFPETKRGKFFLVIATFVAALILTALVVMLIKKATLEGLILSIPFFPAGLVDMFLDPLLIIIYGPNIHTGDGETIMLEGLFIVWLLYLAIIPSIVFIKNRRASRILFFVFVILLIANIAGCSIYS